MKIKIKGAGWHVINDKNFNKTICGLFIERLPENHTVVEKELLIKFKKNKVSCKECLKKISREESKIWEGNIENDTTDIIFNDSDKQKLYFRVGAVFFKDRKEKLGLWIKYQDLENKKYKGPLLMSEKMWGKLKNSIDKEFENAKHPKPCPY